MILLIAGLAIWVGVHWLKRLAPDLRAAMTSKMGEASKGVIAVALVLSVVLIVIGFRSMDFIPIWNPPSFFGHINNLLMLVALYTFGAGGPKGAKVWLGTKIRHPQLTGFSIWAVAHLLVNGDLAGLLLFGTMLIWAQGSVALINRAEGAWTPPERAPVQKEISLVVITLVLFLVVSAVHIWLGYSPFGGV